MRQAFKLTILMVIWIAAALILVYMASIDLYDQEQFILAAASLLLIIILRSHYIKTPEKNDPLRLSRLLIMLLTGLMVMRYIVWRIQYSIPWYSDTFSLILSLMLLLAELFAIALFFMGTFTVIHPLRREPVPFDKKRNDLPTIDVFIPTYNESSSLLRSTLLAVTSMTYPDNKMKVYLLDDGGTIAKCNQMGESGDEARRRKESLKLLCHEVGCNYLTREDNRNAKAGNINAALKKTSSELVLVFDSDHVPVIDFLEQTIGTLLKDPEIALLQTPHHMINQDPMEKSAHAKDSMPHEGDMFYSLNLRGMDNWNAGFFCGSGAIVSRKALEDIGGLCTDTIVEDADSSMEMLRRGYKTAYLHTPLLAGLSSESIEAMIVQRSRWAAGMIQLFRIKNPFFRRGLSLAQRICYINCIAYWSFALARMIFLLTPVAALMFGTIFFAAPPSEILLYVIPYLLGLYLTLNVMYGRVRWMFVSDVYDTFTSVLLSGTVLRTWINPGHKEFKVTPKEITTESESLSTLSWRFYILIAIQVFASIYGGYTLITDPSMYDQTVISLAWNTYNMIFTFAALGCLINQTEMRHRPRIHLNDEPMGIHLGDRVESCSARDMTEDGAQLVFPASIDKDEILSGKLKLVVPSSSDDVNIEQMIPIVLANHFCDKEGRLHLGVEFTFASIEERRVVINYLYGDSQRWIDDLKNRHKQSTIMHGILFVGRAFVYGLVHLLMLFKRPFQSSDTQTSPNTKEEISA